MGETFELLVNLPAEEKERFRSFIRQQRNIVIKSARDTIQEVTLCNKDEMTQLLDEHRVSDAILKLRELAFDDFLKQEYIFNGVVLSAIGQKFDTPKAYLEKVGLELLNACSLSQKDFILKINNAFGEYSGFISPYIYELCLSNTQSRRSRAGKIFENIIYYLYAHYGFAFESQSTIGKKSFSNLNLGKVVDSILPGTQAFKDNRGKTIVGSMKTTLRERWQEVVEEIQRSNLPNIHLLTIDDDISINKANQMALHNIILVVLKPVKRLEKLENKRTIIDFETYFTYTIPDIMKYWGNDLK